MMRYIVLEDFFGLLLEGLVQEVFKYRWLKCSYIKNCGISCKMVNVVHTALKSSRS